MASECRAAGTAFSTRALSGKCLNAIKDFMPELVREARSSRLAAVDSPPSRLRNVLGFFFFFADWGKRRLDGV